MTKAEKRVIKEALAVYMDKLQSEYDRQKNANSLNECIIVAKIWDDIFESKCGTVTI